ncbi:MULTISPECIES: DNA-directed RNA polymerase subunit beta [Sorangium]|uniref:DNA-directed RNA polymerase subunit beta n=2 Tax=Sorangium TaxID=39643 RepID=RPOB_SORC5|nr:MULTISPECIES: DNA-directed RNA polymerase subunit beta [Sorangium]A9GRB1.1 RecName: Full=DNA-directed RNA polymerase subunit beta; Short=RNAP subunit beta; AltName: Full=RNA polymerase subunit beta; AltName: Full=Transcriptase subunit beta [Sorangium cellulosum So ce56]MDC0680489.1 DNA-directed RNA polymerase subunit beta [Sorangium aterium]CAN90567.1 DNA-directed RNA polymerase [Sorangium cellulosum So ce56]
MPSVVQSNFRVRKNLGRVRRIIDVPNLIDIQKSSYDKFLQMSVPPNEREEVGLQAVFRSVFPIKDFNGTSELVFVSYNLEPPKYDVDECRQRGMTYSAPIKVTNQLMIYDTRDGGERIVRDIKEQEVYFGELPLMTETGTFIINGTERVVVSQLHRSPGVFFDHDKGKTHSSGKLLYSARVIPYRGSWLDFEFDPKDIIYVRIDRRRKMHATVLLRALGYSTQDLLNYFYSTETVYLEKGGKYAKSIEYDLLAGQRTTRDIKIGNDVIVKKNTKFTRAAIRKMKEAKLERLSLEPEELVGKVAAHDIVDPETGEVVVEVNEELTEAKLERLRDANIEQFRILFIDGLNVGSYLRDTLLTDKVKTMEDSILEIYRRLRPGDPPTLETAKTLFHNLFFNAERYDLSKVGRLKLNYKFYRDVPEDERPGLDLTVLTPQDILETVRHLIELKNGRGSVDDIDHLGNRRVRAVGELMENQYRIGLVRMERAIKERMSMSQEIDTLMPHDLINAKPVSAVVKEYFGSSQLSQFMDQTNPLSEVTHKRRLSALGPGGLTRERAGFEVRDVHATHYGRICPIETPEGPNIGLIASLSTFARVNEFGFVETPYRKVENGRVTEDVIWLSALEEEGKYIAQATVNLDEGGRFKESLVSARYNGEFKIVTPEMVELMDVAPNQMVSVAAALVPFLEHDDANRALMGANMQRQAVPLVQSHAPLVGTGMEERLARDSGVCVIARRPGVVESVDATRIVVRAEGEGAEVPDIYHLMKFQRSNQSTCYTQKPVVRTGEVVKKGDVLADGPSTDMGELALGQNVLVAFMPWQGYNFEDSILVSERIAKDDVFTSIHIEEFECVARDTKLGKEEITRDIPNVGEEALKDLDDSGIVRIGAEVRPGDILVGKITPKGETQLSPEEKLLRAIFGEKAGDVRDSSLKVPPGVGGIVINARVFSRKGTEKDDRARDIEDQERARIERTRDEEIKILRDSFFRRIRELLLGKEATGKLVDDKGKVLFQKGAIIDEPSLAEIPRKYWGEIPVDDAERVQQILRDLEELVRTREEHFRDKIDRLSKGDELPPGVIKMVKVYIAIKRKLQVGDKMAGRHGNKGVISRILPEEDMPYLQDGRPVDLVLNPLGVPSRMNVGQILEIHLGWGAFELGNQLQRMIEQQRASAEIKEHLKAIYAGDETMNGFFDNLDDGDVKRFVKTVDEGVFMGSPVFDGAHESDIKGALDLAGLPTSGQAILFDGRTGDAFDQNVTVGIMYMLKLHHLVDDKIHARSIGPYSLVTQQPLGGKAQFGGQRLGEMEVWAMEAYGAAYALQEFLTVKSDDVMGRTRMYEAIVKGDYTLEAGLPESFNVLIKELQSLCLNVELVETSAGVEASAAEEEE